MGLRYERVILHSDCNCFYASVEMHHHPELRGKAVAVGGEPELRHGIVLAKSPAAKAAGVKTGEALWQARKKCPDLIVIPPDYRAYMRYARLARALYYQYTDQVEPFGLDESWLDVTGSLRYLGDAPLQIAEEISERIKSELGITVSIGVSWNKVFAKLGSDSDPGDGIIQITHDNYRECVWPAPVENLIYVGPATRRKLAQIDIHTVGELACAREELLEAWLGKMGPVLRLFANGLDTSPVKVMDAKRGDVIREVKSIGNGLTAPHDITSVDDAKALIYLLAESVAQRVRESGFKAQTIGISVRDARFLMCYSRQHKLEKPTCLTSEIAAAAFALLQANEPLDGTHPLRALSVHASQLVSAHAPIQLDLFGIEQRREDQERLDHTVDYLRRRFGNLCIRRLSELRDPSLRNLDVKEDNVVHPVGFFGK